MECPWAPGGGGEGGTSSSRPRPRKTSSGRRRGEARARPAWGSRANLRRISSPGMARAFRSPHLDSVTEDKDDDEARVGPARGDGRGARPRPPEPRDLRLRRPGPGAPAAPCRRRRRGRRGGWGGPASSRGAPSRCSWRPSSSPGWRCPGRPPRPRRGGPNSSPKLCHGDGDGVLPGSQADCSRRPPHQAPRPGVAADRTISLRPEESHRDPAAGRRGSRGGEPEAVRKAVGGHVRR